MVFVELMLKAWPCCLLRYIVGATRFNKCDLFTSLLIFTVVNNNVNTKNIIKKWKKLFWGSLDPEVSTLIMRWPHPINNNTDNKIDYRYLQIKKDLRMRCLPPSGSTPNILVVLSPRSLMAAATPESKPPPPQHTITTSGSGISSNISRPALQYFTNTWK